MAAVTPARQHLKTYPWYAFGILIAVAVWQLCALALGPYRLPSLVEVANKLFPLLTASAALSFQGGGDHGYLPHLLHTIGFTDLSIRPNS